MNYIQQAYKGEYEWWKYAIGLLVIVSFWQIIGFFPFFGALVAANGFESLSGLSMDAMLKVFDKNTTLFLMLLSFAIGFLGLFLVMKFIHKQSITSLTTSRNKIDWKRVFFAFSVWGIIVASLTILAYYLTPEDFIWNLDWSKFIVLAIIGIVLIPLQTSFEEYLFRGYLLQGLGVLVRNRWFPLLFTSLIFGLMHGANPEVDKLGPIIMVYYIGTGLFLGIITLMDEGLELAIGFHAANNLITALLVTADWTAFQTNSILRDISEPSAGIDILLPVLVIFPILLFVFAKKYGWNNWKERLTGKIEEVSVFDDDYKILE
ncbi:MAG: CPBP family intramembrane metalloprotease [Flavobacteriaceae bacterium]|nr:CPBP family intramembrane metalloprotease [Flavobacteriaceae bacterium]